MRHLSSLLHTCATMAFLIAACPPTATWHRWVPVVLIVWSAFHTWAWWDDEVTLANTAQRRGDPLLVAHGLLTIAWVPTWCVSWVLGWPAPTPTVLLVGITILIGLWVARRLP